MATVQTSAQPIKAGKHTYYLTRSDGEETRREVELRGNYFTQALQARVLVSDDHPGDVSISFRTGSFDLFAGLTPDEADLISHALANAAADARKAAQAAQIQKVGA